MPYMYDNPMHYLMYHPTHHHMPPPLCWPTDNSFPPNMIFHAHAENVNMPNMEMITKSTCGNVPPGWHGGIDKGHIHIEHGGEKMSTKIDIGKKIGTGEILICPTGPTDVVNPNAPIINFTGTIPF